MKKLFYSVAVIIAMLCTACENFDHAIADQNDRLDVLEQSTIKNIDEQVESINASLKKLEAVDAELKTLIEALKSEDNQDKHDELIAQFEAKDAELEKKIADLKAYLDDELSKSKDWANATFATLEQYTDIQEEISSLSTLIDQHKADMSEAIAEAVENAVTSLETSISALETSMKKWVNEILAEGYYDIATIDAKLEALEKKLAGADDALAKELKDQAAALEQAKKDLTAAYEKAIADAIQTNNGVISKEIADAVQKVMDQVEDRLTDITNDLAAIQKDIESIKGSIATIEEQIAAIEKSLTDLKTVDQNLQKLIDDLQTALKNLEANAGSSEDLEAITDLIDALELKDAALDKKIADLESYVKTELANSKDWANATFATLEQYGAMQKEMSDLKALINTYKSDVTTAYTQAIKDAISASETGMKTWVNEALAGYYKTAEVDALLSALETKLSGADSELSKKIEDQKTALETAKSELTTAYQAAIAKAISDYDGQIQPVLTTINEALTSLQDQIDDINEEIADIKERLGIVEEAIEALVARIQSIRFVPEYSDGKVELCDETVLTFLLSPKDAAASITEEHVTAYIVRTKVRTKAVDTPTALTVKSVSGSAEGVLEVTVSDSGLSEDFWRDYQDANIYICISDENNDIISEMIPICSMDILDTEEEFLEAFAAGEVKLEADITLTSRLTVSNGQNVTVDLNGYTLSTKSGLARAENYNMFNVSGGVLTIKNGTVTIQHEGTNMGYNAQVTVFSIEAGGVVNVADATVKNLGGSDLALCAHLNNWGEATLNVENSTLESTYIAVRVYNSGNDKNNVSIENTTLKGKYCLWVQYYKPAGDECGDASNLNFNIFNETNTFVNTGKSPVLYGNSSFLFFDENGSQLIYTSPAEFAAALKAGRNVVMTEDFTEFEVSTKAPYGNHYGVAQNGGVLDGKGHTLDFSIGTKNSNGKYDNYGIMTSGGTIKNVNITGVFRGIMIMYPTEDVIIDNVVVGDEDMCYPINTGEGDGTHSLIVTNTTIKGWNSYGSAIKDVTFNNCKFEQGLYYTNVYGRIVKPYVSAVFDGCEFSGMYYIDLSMLGKNNDGELIDPTTKIVLKNCTVNGVKLTAENWTSLVAPEDTCGEGQISIELRDGTYMTADNVADYVIFE